MTPAALRQAIAAHITAELGADGWREAAQAYDAFPDLEGVAHLAFAVGMLRTDPLAGERQRVSVGMRSSTTIGVRFSAVIRAQSAVADYDRALAAEAALVAQLAAFKSDSTAPLRIEGVPTRLVVNGTVYIGEVTCSAAHVYPLSE